MSDIQIIAAVVDSLELTLYKADGSTIKIEQGDPRIQPLVSKVMPILSNQGKCFLSPKELEYTVPNVYKDTEKVLGNKIKFFKVLKESFKKFFGTEESSKGTNPTQSHTLETPHNIQKALSEVMENASSMSASDSPITLKSNETVIAVVNGSNAVGGIEKIEKQLKATASNFYPAESLTKFFERMASVSRGHTTDDLLTFMQKGELPIAKDGSVLVYKLLKKTSEPNVFVDAHTGNVKQRVGSYVYMDETLVDPNRINECSSGLHVARRDYLRSFSGDVCVLVKLAPEDVIAVPAYDARKIRAKAYHIIAQLSDEDFNLVNNDRPMADEILLGNAVEGNHIGITNRVHILNKNATEIEYLEMGFEDLKAQDESLKHTSLDVLVDEEKKSSSVNVSELIHKDKASKPAPSQPIKKPKHMDILIDAFMASASGSKDERYVRAKNILDFKKKSKKSWENLGVSQTMVEVITKILDQK